MKKYICDFCKKETDDAKEYMLPTTVPLKVMNENVVIATLGYETQDEKKDVCTKCRDKIATLLELMPKVKIVESLGAISVSFEESEENYKQ